MGILVEKLKHIAAKPVSLLLFLLPIAVAASLGALLEKQQKELIIPIAIVDEDQTAFSQRIVEQMRNQERIVVKEVSNDKGQSLLSRNEIDSLFVIKKQFQQRLMDEQRENTIELWTSPSSAASGIVREVVASEVIRLTSSIKAANRVVSLYNQKNREAFSEGVVWHAAHDYTNDQWEPSPLMTIHYVHGDQPESKKPSEREKALFVPYLGIWSFFTMLSCFITADWAVKERFTLFTRIMTTGKGLTAYLSQTAGAYIVFQMLQALVSFLVLSSFQAIERNYFLLVGMGIYIIFSSAVGMWIAGRMQHLGGFYALSIFIAFILAVCGGSFFPVAEVSSLLHALSNWLPQQILWQTAYSTQMDSGSWKVAIMMIFGALLLWKWTIWRLKPR